MVNSTNYPFLNNLPEDIRNLLVSAPKVTLAGTVRELENLAVRDVKADGWHDVAFDVPGKGNYVEARVSRVRNGIAANYTEAYMRRRDPDSMVIGDDLPTDQMHFTDRFKEPFDNLRGETFEWMKTQELAMFAFSVGENPKGFFGLAIVPANSGFFALGLAMIQGIIPRQELDENFRPTGFILCAPTFRHTYFGGKQVVVHNRVDDIHELFSYNLYPGPSAKKGVYGMLLHRGEQEGWVTAHCSTVQVITPYDNQVTFMHEGASGGGKSEMLEYPHRERDGRLKLGKNMVTGETAFFTLPRGCELHPVTDDMALCHRTIYSDKKLRLADAEKGWFLRVNHIANYGTDPHLESITINTEEPLLFLNIDAVPSATSLIWQHTMDEPGCPCPNPRVIVPRSIFPNVVDGDVTVDIRSFGVRAPLCTRGIPTYGIMGVFHILPPALAWLWRLTAPRGANNPSIITQGAGLTSEGVGSFWPFATGKRVEFANLLLKQIMSTTNTMFILTPNQHVGAWHMDFMPQWIAREYLARRGPARFRPDQLTAARCPLLGYTPTQLHMEANILDPGFLRVNQQPEVGPEAYDAGAKMLTKFFYAELENYLTDDMDPLGRRIIEMCLSGCSVKDYDSVTL